MIATREHHLHHPVDVYFPFCLRFQDWAQNYVILLSQNKEKCEVLTLSYDAKVICLNWIEND